MQWMNYHHLYYFWVIAKEGGVTKACKKLRLSQPTLSSQLKQFETFIGQPLFDRKSRKLVLNATGKKVYEYAERIFKMGTELLDSIHGDEIQAWTSLRVGVMSTMPKKDVYDFLQIPLSKPHVHLETTTGNFEELLQQLLQRNLDMILSHKKAPSELKDLYNYSLEKSPIVFVAHKDFKNLRRRFPKSLQGKSLFVPTHHSYIRSEIEEYLKKNEVEVTFKGEIADSELLRVVAISGEGVVAVERSAVSDLIKSKELVELGGELGFMQDSYLISFERKILPPIIKQILKKFK